MSRHLLNYLELEISPIKVYKLLSTLFFSLLVGGFAGAQNASTDSVKVESKLLADSVETGQPFYMSLSTLAPDSVDVLFPDSTYDFSPFEMVHKVYFPTQIRNGNLWDSAVYQLKTFNLDSVQRITPEIIAVVAGDSLVVQGSKDSVFMKYYLQVYPDSLSLKEQTRYRHIGSNFNYPIFTAVGILVFSVLTTLLLIFRKKISNWFQKRSLKKKHKKFRIRFDAAVFSYKKQPDTGQANTILLLWKSYMESLERVPFLKLTSKEIHLKYKDEALKSSLMAIDKSIYSDFMDGDVSKFDYLQVFAENRFNKKLNELDS